MAPTAYKFGMFLLHVVFSTKERRYGEWDVFV